MRASTLKAEALIRLYSLASLATMTESNVYWEISGNSVIKHVGASLVFNFLWVI